MKCFVTICSEQYLPYYRVQYESIKKHSNVEPLLYFIGDNEPTNLGTVINITSWKSNYSDLLTHICSIRPNVVLDAFKRGYNEVLFLGADVVFYDNPDSIFNKISDVVITPHITSPLPEDGLFPSNETIAWAGYLNSDVVFWNNHGITRNFLNWQAKTQETKCVNGPKTFLDQTWLNYVTSFLDAEIIKDPSWNVSYWNFKQRNLNFREGKPFVGNIPLLCYQFSGIDLHNPERISVHQNRETASGDMLVFLKEYIDKVKKYSLIGKING